MNELNITDLDGWLFDFYWRADFEDDNEDQAEAIVSIIKRLRNARDRMALIALQYMNDGEADA